MSYWERTSSNRAGWMFLFKGSSTVVFKDVVSNTPTVQQTDRFDPTSSCLNVKCSRDMSWFVLVNSRLWITTLPFPSWTYKPFFNQCVSPPIPSAYQKIQSTALPSGVGHTVFQWTHTHMHTWTCSYQDAHASFPFWMCVSVEVRPGGRDTRFIRAVGDDYSPLVTEAWAINSTRLSSQ